MHEGKYRQSHFWPVFGIYCVAIQCASGDKSCNTYVENMHNMICRDFGSAAPIESHTFSRGFGSAAPIQC